VSIVRAPATIDVGVTTTLTGQALGGRPPYTPAWSLSTGNITSAWSIEWTAPSAPRTIQALFEVQDGNGWVVSTSVSIRVVPGPFVELSAFHSVADVGLPFLFQLNVTGGVGPLAVHWAIVNGSSNGSTVVPGDGTYAAAVVPASPGPVWVVSSVVDTWNRSFSGSSPLGRATASPSLAPASVPFAEVGYPTYVSVAVADGTPPFVWSAPPVAGVSSETPSQGTLLADGAISLSVTFDRTGNYSLPVRIADASGAIRESNVSIVVAGGLNVSVALGSPTVAVGATVSVVASVSGGLPPYAYRFSLSDNEQTSGNVSAPGPVRWSATPVAAGYLTLHGSVVDGTGRVANVMLTLYVGASGGSSAPTAASSPGAGPLAAGAAAAGAIVGIVGVFLLRRWWRWPSRPGPSEPAGRAERAVVREILAESDDGMDRATLELLAEERRLTSTDVASALSAWQRAGRVRVEEADDGREVVRWVAPSAGAAAAKPEPVEEEP
jgi:hypothetical protein